MTLSACSANPAEALLPDSPEQATTTPSPGLTLTASLDHSLIAPGRSARFDVELKNVGAGPLQVAPGGPCNLALLVSLRDGTGQVVWSEPMPMCAPIGTPAPFVLAPGQSVRGSQCFGLDTQTQGCAVVDLPRATYRIAGSFHGQTLPQLNLRVAAHSSSRAPVPAPGGGTGSSGGGQVPGTAAPITGTP